MKTAIKRLDDVIIPKLGQGQKNVIKHLDDNNIQK